MAKPGPAPEVTTDDVLAVFDARDDQTEPLTATEVADAVGCSRTTALDRLDTLDEQGSIASKKVGGRARVWWVPTETTERDLLVGYGSWTGTDLAETVAAGREELDADLREDERVLS